MEEILEFELGFLDQSPKDHFEPSIPNLQMLASRIEETNNLVNIINSLKSENDALKRRLKYLTRSTYKVHSLYENEKLRANGLSKLNDEFSCQIGEMKKLVLQLQSKLKQKACINSNLQEKRDCSIGKCFYNCLTNRNNDTSDKYLCKISGNSAYSKGSVEEINSDESFTQKSTEIMLLDALTKCDSNRLSQMVSRGTQYQSSTTTRATCTASFIKKHNVAVNFPEVLPIPIEDILQETLAEIPNLLSPIQDIPEEYCDTLVQAVPKQPTTVVTSDLRDIANEIEIVPNQRTSSEFLNADFNFINHSENLCPNLSDLWELLGQTIFALIGNNSPSIINDVGCKVDILKRKIGQFYEPDSGSKLKQEMKQSFFYSPEISQIKDLRQFHFKENKPKESNFSSINKKAAKLLDVKTTQKKLLNNLDIITSETCGIEEDTQLAAVKNEIESLGKKTLVLSPIKERGHFQSLNTINKKEAEGKKKWPENKIDANYPLHNTFGEVCNASQLNRKSLKKQFNQRKKPLTFKFRPVLKLQPCNLKLERRASSHCIKYEKLSSNVESIANSERNPKHNISSIFERSVYGEPNPNALFEGKIQTVGFHGVTKSNLNDQICKDSNLYDRQGKHVITNTKKDNTILCPNIQPYDPCQSYLPQFAKSSNHGYIARKKEASHQINQELKVENDVVLEINQEQTDKGEFHRFTFENSPNNNRKNNLYLYSGTSPQVTEAYIPQYSLKIIPLKRQEDISDYSPSSPYVETVDPLLIPLEIPIHRKQSNNSKCMQSLLGRFIMNYKNFQHNICVKKNKIETPNEGKLLRGLRKIIELYLVDPEKKWQQFKCAKRILSRCKESRLISTAIFEVIEDTDEEISNEHTPPAPAMTRSHLKIIILIDALNARCIGIDKKLIFHLDQRIFNLKSCSMEQKSLINLLLLYLGLIDLQKSGTNPARLVIYKSLYYFKKMSFPMIYYVLVSYPDVLPAKDETYYDDPDPLVDTIQSILNSQPYDMEETHLKQREIFHILRLYYKYERVQPSREDVVEKLLLNLHSNKFRNISYCFALLCKRNSLKWSLNFVLKQKLLPTFDEYISHVGECNNSHDDKITCLLESISSILKAIPVQNDISSYRQLFVNILNSSYSQPVQEAAAFALLRTSKFGYKECFKLLYKWNPPFRISRLLHVSMNTFIHRNTLKTLKRWEKQ